MPRTKEQNEDIKEQKRELIKQSALRLFASEGYEKTNILQIAQKANVSKGLMYNYFKNKEELLTAIMNDLSQEFCDMIDPNHDGVVSDEEAAGFIDAMFNIMITRKEEMKLYYQISFQSKVINFLQHNFDRANYMKRYQLLMQYFTKKIDMGDDLSAFLTITSFLKGLFMVYTYTDEMFTREFIMQYKEIFKSKFCK
jgi:AcrR family transcriptional regulator